MVVHVMSSPELIKVSSDEGEIKLDVGEIKLGEDEIKPEENEDEHVPQEPIEDDPKD